MIRRRICVILAAAIVAEIYAMPGHACGKAPERATIATRYCGISVGDLQHAILDVHDRIASVEATYVLMPSGRALVRPRHYSRHHIAHKGRLRFAENVHYRDEARPEFDLNHTKQYFTVDTFDVFYVNSRFYETSVRNAKDVYPWKLRVDPYLSAVGWWPKDDTAPPENLSDRGFRPLRFILADAACSIEGDTDTVDGHKCVVLSRPGIDRLWLDPKIAYAIRRREVLHPLTLKVLNRVSGRDFNSYSLSNGHVAWFPMRLDIERVTWEGTDRDKPVIDSAPETIAVSFRVESLKINDVHDEIFRFSPPPGTLIQDRDTGTFSMVRGGYDLLDHSVSVGMQVLRPHNEDNRRLYWVLGASICVGAFICIVPAIRRRCATKGVHNRC